jgi:hypothetical protein
MLENTSSPKTIHLRDQNEFADIQTQESLKSSCNGNKAENMNKID